MTESIKRTIEITSYRRAKQIAYNQEHGITPRSVKRSAQASLHVYDGKGTQEEVTAVAETNAEEVAAVIAELEEEMQEAAGRLEFERAALLRDQIGALRSGDFKKLSQKPAAKKGKPRGFSGARRR
jgi:excinuclease ABC subunit B